MYNSSHYGRIHSNLCYDAENSILTKYSLFTPSYGLLGAFILFLCKKKATGFFAQHLEQYSTYKITTVFDENNKVGSISKKTVEQ